MDEVVVKQIGIDIGFGVSGTYSNTRLRTDGKLVLSTRPDGSYYSSGYWESDVVDLVDKFREFDIVALNRELEGTSKVGVMTRTSDDGTTFDDYIQITESGKIQSEVKRYIQVRILFYAGFEKTDILISDFMEHLELSFWKESDFVEANSGLRLKENYYGLMKQDKVWAEKGYLYTQNIPNTDYKRIDSIASLTELVKWDTVNSGMGAGVIFTNNDYTATINNPRVAIATKGVTSGKWYWEITYGARVAGTYNSLFVGVVDSLMSANGTNHATDMVRYYFANSGVTYPGGSAYGEAFGESDVISVLLDMDEGTISFYRNGVNQGVAFTNLKDMVGKVYPACGAGGNTASIYRVTANFGGSPFRFEVPEGYEPYQTYNPSFVKDSEGYKVYVSRPDSLNLIPNMTSNTAPSGVASSNSETREAWKAFDGKTEELTDSWLSRSAKSDVWLAYEFEEKKTVVGYSLISSEKGTSNETEMTGRMPRIWRFEGSNDSLDWVTLDTRETSDWEYLVSARFFFENSQEFKVYRLYIEQNNGGTHTSLGEMEMFGTLEGQVLGSYWKTVSNTLPSYVQFADEGMKDLDIFDRRVREVMDSPQKMTATPLGEGKVYKGTIDLRKLFDLRKLEVKR